MKKAGLQILIIFLYVAKLNAQSSSDPSLLSTTGYSLQNDNISFSYSIGEIAINTISSSYTVGFLQPFTNSISPQPPILPETPLIVYQFLSPNQDGENETFYIEGLNAFPENEVIIFDRNGKIVFSKKNYDNGWTGENLIDGSYFYIVKIPRNKLELKGGLVVSR